MKIFYYILLLISITLTVFSQRMEHLSVHCSINDITYYRNLFSSNKIKSVSAITNGTKNIYSIDTDGKILKMDNSPASIVYKYDSKSNLIAISYPMGDDMYMYDANGNMNKEIQDEVTYNYKYDSNNNITAIDASESMIEAIGSKSVQYNEGKLYEIVYECMGEGNYNIYTKEIFEYNGNDLQTIKRQTIDCRNNKIKSEESYKYEYNSSGLPLKEIYTDSDGTKTITEFFYENYE